MRNEVRYFYWDTRALIKHFLPELGTAIVNRIFDRVPIERMLATTITMGELVSIVVRHRNTQRQSEADWAAAMLEIEQTVIDHPAFNWVDTGYGESRRSLGLISAHSLNARDALILQTALDAAPDRRTAGDTQVLVSSEARVVRAARAEGLTVFNPETETENQLDTLLAA